MNADPTMPPAGPGAAAGVERPIVIELVKNGLAAVADEMAIAHVRAAYSTVVRDLLDFSTAVCDGQGRVLAQGLTLPLQLGAIPGFMRDLRARVTEFERGDVYVVNDPWQGGVHLPDFFFASPVFLDGEDDPVGFTVIVSHMVDVGGPTPGGVSPAGPSIWHEGFVLPMVPLRRRGVVNDVLLDVIAANTRDPAKVLGDIRAVLAGLDTGGREIRRLATRLGVGRIRSYMETFLEHTEAATLAAMMRIPDGSGAASDYLDDDGVGGPPVYVECTVVKEGSRMHFDFTGTAGQVPGGVNCTVTDLASVVALVTRATLEEDLALNDGFERCLSYTIPEGTIANAQHPAAVSARATTMYRVCDVAMAAVAQFVPGRIPANDGGPATVYMSGREADGGEWIMLDYVHCGWGATATHDGVRGVSHAISNAANMPAEIIEQQYPVRIRHYRMLADTAGDGEFVGSPAVSREYEILQDGTFVTARLERCAHPAPGQHGGSAGSCARCQVRRGAGEWEAAPGKSVFTLQAGDRLRIQLGAGGGFGEPGRRSPAARQRDRRDGLRS